ncbi:hypothetical protein QVD17_36383 [Tagetes erecta]|uniref:Uncharacterized protein n=1 Tax=Tagetes erecta TaxID=13708 RepID=A0AAD8JSC5_TARER|nr:hypothetical protein QVD17_36383 [Tagetes erecta]
MFNTTDHPSKITKSTLIFSQKSPTSPYPHRCSKSSSGQLQYASLQFVFRAYQSPLSFPTPSSSPLIGRYY